MNNMSCACNSVVLTIFLVMAAASPRNVLPPRGARPPNDELPSLFICNTGEKLCLGKYTCLKSGVAIWKSLMKIMVTYRLIVSMGTLHLYCHDRPTIKWNIPHIYICHCKYNTLCFHFDILGLPGIRYMQVLEIVCYV